MKYEPEPKEICPNQMEHTEQPEGYLDWMSWADRHHKDGWRQKKCPGCGFYAIWILPQAAPAAPTPHNT